MEKEFLNRYYSTCHTVSMMELTNMRQWKDEHIVDYINRWLSLSLDCKDCISEASGWECASKVCIGDYFTSSKGLSHVPLKNLLLRHITWSLACLAMEKKAYPLIKIQREVTSTPILLLRSLLPSLQSRFITRRTQVYRKKRKGVNPH